MLERILIVITKRAGFTQTPKPLTPLDVYCLTGSPTYRFLWCLGLLYPNNVSNKHLAIA